MSRSEAHKRHLKHRWAWPLILAVVPQNSVRTGSLSSGGFTDVKIRAKCMLGGAQTPPEAQINTAWLVKSVKYHYSMASEFDPTGNGAVRSAVPENPTLEPNMKGIG